MGIARKFGSIKRGMLMTWVCLLCLTGLQAQTLRVGLLLPLGNSFVEDSSLRMAGKPDPVTRLAVEYWQGFKLGLEKHCPETGLIECRVYADQGTVEGVDSLFKTELPYLNDLLVGPFFPEQLSHISNRVEARGIPWFNPLAPKNLSELCNPYLIGVQTPLSQMGTLMGAYSGRELDSILDVFILLEDSLQDAEYYRSFRQALQKENKRVRIRKFQLNSTSLSGLRPHLNPLGMNLVFIGSGNPEYTARVLLGLNALSREFGIKVAGHPKWYKNPTLDLEAVQKLGGFFPVTGMADYQTAAMLPFRQQYVQLYKSEPDEYALKGYELGWMISQQYARYGAQWFKKWERSESPGLVNLYQFTESQSCGIEGLSGSGWVNTAGIIVEMKQNKLERVFPSSL